MSDNQVTNPSPCNEKVQPTGAGNDGDEERGSGGYEHRVEVRPNPLTAHSKLIVQLYRGEYVRAELYDIGGQRMERLFEGYMEAGEFRIPIKRNLLHTDTCICIVEIAGRKYHQVLTSEG